MSNQTNLHQDNIAPTGFVSENYMSLVHTQILIGKVRQIPGGAAALEKEWKKLEDKSTWLLHTVRPRAEVIEEARINGLEVHVGSFMELCHIKNSQLGKEFWVYKGRIVFMGRYSQG